MIGRKQLTAGAACGIVNKQAVERECDDSKRNNNKDFVALEGEPLLRLLMRPLKRNKINMFCCVSGRI